MIIIKKNILITRLFDLLYDTNLNISVDEKYSKMPSNDISFEQNKIYVDATTYW